MLTAMADRPEIRSPVLGVLTKLKYYEAIDPLIVIARQEDPTAYEPAWPRCVKSPIPTSGSFAAGETLAGRARQASRGG